MLFIFATFVYLSKDQQEDQMERVEHHELIVASAEAMQMNGHIFKVEAEDKENEESGHFYHQVHSIFFD